MFSPFWYTYAMAERIPFLFKDSDQYTPGEIIIPAKVIDHRIEELASQIVREYAKKNLLVIGLLTGGVWLTVDLLTHLHKQGVPDTEVNFIKVVSYPTGTTALHEPQLAYDVSIHPQGRDILIVDDIVDTGKSLALVENVFKSKDVRSIKSIVLLNKPSRRKVPYEPTYTGFTIPDIWVQGRGMDSDGYGRGDPNIIKGPYHYPQ